MISRRFKNLEEGLERLEMEAQKVGLKVNRAKTQYLFSSRKSTTGNNKFIELNGNKYERCDKFKYLGVLVTKDNEMKEEIKARIAAGNRVHQDSLKVMKSHNLSRNLKIKVYRTVVRPVVMYVSETWTMTAAEEELLKRWERKVLRKIFGATKEDG
ncbi:hypothetical protein J437_LFUL016694 [Ladona fulva]|uniref:Endonuclease-reverse transcriptase n=1 Tax=Ladona fulva TaxID=123851 RepID=A0A8K0KS36_LADFU|nr:hypothetical protein J437_LFUL016694 [Ladona fulva]